jgi:uncharacterized membrane protein
MTEGLMNLSVPRGEKSVWDEPRWHQRVGDRERWITAAWGTGLAMRGGFVGGMVAMLGSVLAVRAARGHHDIGAARQFLDRTLKERGWRRDIVQDALEESFPASDAPAWRIAD